MSEFTSPNSNPQATNASVFYKSGIPFVHLPIPPTYKIKNFILHPEMTFESLTEAIKVEQSDVEIWTAGTSGEDSLAAAAVDRFCLALGAVAGDIALVQGASGVVIAGGLGLRIRETLLASGFADRFRAKGRFAGLMASLPVKVITHPQPGLLGAAAAFAQTHFEESRP